MMRQPLRRFLPHVSNRLAGRLFLDRLENVADVVNRLIWIHQQVSVFEKNNGVRLVFESASIH